MATADLLAKQGDTATVWPWTITDADGNPVSLTGSITLNATYLNAGGAQTAITVDPLPFDVPSGTKITMANADVVTASAPASQGATSISINSQTPSAGPGWVSASTITVPASVKFVMRSQTDVAPVVNAAATIVNAAAGSVSYTPTAADTSVPGYYAGVFTVTFPAGGVQTFPTDGYLDIWIEANLLAANQQLVSLPDAKQFLRIQANNRDSDAMLLRFIAAVRPVVEAITGPIIVAKYDEWYEGGNTDIVLRHRPSTGFGTSPVLNILAVSEYRGPIEWAQAQIASPDLGQLYSVMTDSSLGMVVRRTAGGGVSAFPSMPQSVHVVYEAGQSSVPDNVTEGTLRLIQLNFQESQQAGFPGFGQAFGDNEDTPRGAPVGFFVPGSVRELLQPTRKHSAIA